MSEEIKDKPPEEDVKEEKKSALKKLKDAILPDQEEQAAIISTFVRLGVLVWSGGILTLNYVAIPGVPQQKIDPTFIASVFTGVLASFGIQTASKKGDGTMKMSGQNGNGNGVGKNGGPTQTLVIEQAPLKIIAVDPSKKEEKYTL
jgi:hypothetical protein|tara:strand:- start:1225 stop:1662 length:438 start_codon:yes stop_codon:yes gene_type:complete